MKNLTNILSYLWLLLLMAVTACSDLEEEVGPMQGEEEVELTIQTEVSGMKGSTRTAPTESITAITAYAFDSNSQLIKEVKAILSDDKQSTSGYLKIKVPKRTGDIHFIAKNNAESPDVKISIGDNVSTLLSQTTDELHYWGKATYNGGNNLSVTLYRNMAKVTLKTGVGFTPNSCYIAGFVNLNLSGTVVPGGHAVGDTPTIPNNVEQRDYTADNRLGNVYYLFEHANVENNNPLYVIIEVDDKYYKIAFANANKEYFPIIRNHAYTITINSVEESLGGTYDEALLADPINDANVEVQAVTMEILPVSLTSYKGNTCQVTVPIPNGVTELSVTPDDDAFSVTSATLDDVAISPNNDVYIVTGGNTAKFSLTLDDNFIGTTGDHTISFEGSGALVNATGTAIITLNGFVDMYEMYFDDGKLGGSTEYDKFFYDKNNVNLQTKTLTTQYVDAGANGSSLAHNHVNAAINMQSNSTIKFTIDEERYLTLLVASNNDNKPSIQLSNGIWATDSSEDDVVPDYYNFGNGEIGTSGRLIRYTLPAGTYTLQRGNNDYLLYYMRVTKDKPTMTDIVQPAASDYSLSWSDNSKERFLKESATKYFVDEEATNFIPTLTYNGLSKVSLSTVKLDVTTDVWTFENKDDSSQGSMQQDTRNYTEANISSLTYNEGAYTLSGSVTGISGTSYKYATFYDNLQLKSVSFNVKNTVKVALYNSWDSDAATVDRYNDETPLIIGFKMPQHTLPIEPGNYINFAINKEWVREASGSGIAYETNGDVTNYRIGNQDNHYHTRTEWTYKIQWRDVAAEEITVTTTDADVYFSYKGNISKTQTIDTPIDNDKLNIALDFYADVDNKDGITDAESNRSENGNVYDDLRLGTSRFFLKATISYEDAKKFASNGSVQLKGDYSTLNGCAIGGLAINWGGSKQSGAIDCTTDGNGTSLNFTIQQNQTEYLIEWVFVPGQYYNGGDIGFAYNIGNVNGKNYELSGETRADIAFTNENDYTPSTPSENGVIFNCNFNDGLDGFTHQGQGSVSSNNGTLILNNGEDRAYAWDAQAMYETDKIQYGATYTLSFKAKIANNTTQGAMAVAIQRFENGECVATDHYRIFNIDDIKNAEKDNQDWAEFTYDITIQDNNQETPNENNPTHFMFNFGDLVGTLNIDDLRLVKKN